MPTSRSWALTTWARSACSIPASLLGISVASPATAQQLRKSLPQSSYGQGQVVASPFQMARVAATVANGGQMPQGRWIADESNDRTQPPQAVLAADVAATLGRFMREVVTERHRPARGRRAACRSPARPARPNWPTRLRTPGSSASRPIRRGARKIAFCRAGGEWPVWRHVRGAGGRRAGDRGAEPGPDRRGETAGLEYSHEFLFGSRKDHRADFRKWTERAFGPAQSDELLLVHRAILEEIEGKIQTVQRGQRLSHTTI